MNPSQIPGPLVTSMLASMAAIGLWRAPITTFVTLGSGTAGYWLGIQKIVSVKPPRTWLANDHPPDPLAADLDLRQLRQEIRETATTIAGLRQELATTKTQYSGELSNLSSRLNPLESSTSKASSQLQTLQNSFQELNQRLSQDLRQLSDQLMSNSRSLTRLETELINIQQRLAAATLDLSVKDDGLNRRIEPIETEIRRLATLVVAARGNTAVVASPIETKLSERLTKIEAQLPSLASKPELQTLKIDTHSLTEAFQRLDTDLRSLTQRVSNFVIPEAVDLSFLEASVSQLGEDNLQVQQSLEELQHGFHTMQTTGLSAEKALDIKVLYARTEDLQHHIDELQQTLAAAQTQYSRDFTALSSRISPVEIDDSETRRILDQVQTDLSELNRQLNQAVQHLAAQQQPREQVLTQLATDLLSLQQQLTQFSETQLTHSERLSQLEPLAFELRNLREQIQQTSAAPVNLEPLETTLAQFQQQLEELVSQAGRDRVSLNNSIQTLSNTCERLDTDLQGLSSKFSNLTTLSHVDLVPLQATIQQLASELAEFRLESQNIAAQISKPIADSGIDMKVIYGRTEALQQKMDFLKKRFKEIEDAPQPLLLWRDRPAPKERVAQRPDTHRVAVFVDGSNIVKSAEENRVPLSTTEYASNLLNFLENIQGSHSVYFHGFEITSEVSQTLKDIEALGYKVIKRKGKAGRYVKANMDSYIILEMLQYTDAYDTAVLVSGDGDFIPIVHWLRSQNKRVEVLGIHKTVAFGLQDAADFYEAIRVGKHLSSKQI